MKFFFSKVLYRIGVMLENLSIWILSHAVLLVPYIDDPEEVAGYNVWDPAPVTQVYWYETFDGKRFHYVGLRLFELAISSYLYSQGYEAPNSMDEVAEAADKGFLPIKARDSTIRLAPLYGKEIRDSLKVGKIKLAE